MPSSMVARIAATEIVRRTEQRREKCQERLQTSKLLFRGQEFFVLLKFVFKEPFKESE